jgi:hypothetical protein
LDDYSSVVNFVIVPYWLSASFFPPFAICNLQDIYYLDIAINVPTQR